MLEQKETLSKIKSKQKLSNSDLNDDNQKAYLAVIPQTPQTKVDKSSVDDNLSKSISKKRSKVDLPIDQRTDNTGNKGSVDLNDDSPGLRKLHTSIQSSLHTLASKYDHGSKQSVRTVH